MDPGRRSVVVLYVDLGLLFLTVVALLLWYKTHRHYHEYLRRHWPGERERLVKRDSVADAFGEWIRWPVGSAWLFFSIFNLGETYGDNTIRRYKQRAMIYFTLFVGLFVAALGGALLAK
jgi:hypothetical protein